MTTAVRICTTVISVVEEKKRKRKDPCVLDWYDTHWGVRCSLWDEPVGVKMRKRNLPSSTKRKAGGCIRISINHHDTVEAMSWPEQLSGSDVMLMSAVKKIMVGRKRLLWKENRIKKLTKGRPFLWPLIPQWWGPSVSFFLFSFARASWISLPQLAALLAASPPALLSRRNRCVCC